MLLLICNRELLFIGKRKDEDDMAKSTKTYEAVSYTHLLSVTISLITVIFIPMQNMVLQNGQMYQRQLKGCMEKGKNLLPA